MATIHPQVNRLTQNIVAVRWAGIAPGDDCVASPSDLSEYSDRSVQVSGVFGGASLAIRGSNDGTNYAGLSDPQGVALVFSSGGLKAILEASMYVRPEIAGGVGSSIDVTMFLRRGRGGKEV